MDEAELDKSETATPFKLRRAREKGTVARGIDLGFFAVLAAFIAYAWMTGAQAIAAFTQISGATLGNSGRDADVPGALFAQMATLFSAATSLLLGLAATVFAIALLFDFLQVGPVFSAGVLKPDLSRINPANGLKRLLSWRMMIEAAKSVLKLAIYGTIAWLVISAATTSNLVAITDGRQLAAALAVQGLRLLAFFALAALFFAIGDQIIARRQFATKMRMSRRALKREYRDREGDQRFKQKRKQFHSEFMMMAKSLRNARGADVILTNPTHYAVALRYLPDKMEAPMIVSRGAGLLADRIRRIGFSYGVTILQDAPLARALFRTRIVEGEIPDDLFHPVADIYRKHDLVGRGRG
jgi:flagellar biosynthesis protein FlhB